MLDFNDLREVDQERVLSHMLRVAKEVPCTKHYLAHQGLLCPPKAFVWALARDTVLAPLMGLTVDHLNPNRVLVDGNSVPEHKLLAPTGLAQFLFDTDLNDYETDVLVSHSYKATHKNVFLTRLAVLDHAITQELRMSAGLSLWHDRYRRLVLHGVIIRTMNDWLAAQKMRFAFDTEPQC